ncbi:MAG: hypothetical protein JAY99_06985 [Candidatus Thiodiazotropha lotti]|uniref:Uncharacterized protein n=1 Tax=Candidatus Thiodiazotropha endoloripes TaxID=1818881 RepID=A0A1E2UTD4_9GAMM|nr:hypothetical protein [Candidatus Thiodiazotropha endoloripes]MCG7900117.1 hypothetical protein [Candidatus Thiodiazotropha weberae]MCG7990886.1 hypothetical protein [Candidatus Thiodiazotropha lotti]MCG7901517.1 hypothetical protein [Candidatus Thiodiazotropha weberae]MCG7913795.1 hypothetical protein [Candidatus Thiodiazotropha weberae]MCG7999250.1 hypothetical protein [Candidatus Thiodiazotropha lotti]
MPDPSGKETDQMVVDIACLDHRRFRATLISTIGSHCEVWRSSKRHEKLVDGEIETTYTEFVIKWPYTDYSENETKLLARHYRQLKDTLDEIIPDALFVVTKINGRASVLVLAQAINVWFNIANQQNEEEAIKLLCANPKSRIQLSRFVKAAQAWRKSDNPKVIDLFGIDNLIMDTNRDIHFLDSFFVFFFEDTFHLIDGCEEDTELADKVNLSIKRMNYLERLLEQVKASCDQQ